MENRSFYAFFIVISVFAIALILGRFDAKAFLSKAFLSSLKSRFSAQIGAIASCQSPPIIFQTCPNFIQKPKIKSIITQSLLDYKKIFPYILIAMALGAGIHHFLPKEFLQDYVSGSFAELLILAFVGVFLYIRIELALPLGLALLQSGMPKGLMMCLLIAGGGASLPEMILLKSMFRWRFLVIFALIVMGIAVGFGWILNHF